MRRILFLALAALSLPVAAQPIVLKFNSPAPPPSFLHAGAFNPWAKNVTEASGGTLKVEMYYGGTLGGFGVTYDRVLDGVADVGFILTALAKGKFRQQDVAALPFESNSSIAAATALWKIYQKGITATRMASASRERRPTACSARAARDDASGDPRRAPWPTVETGCQRRSQTRS